MQSLKNYILESNIEDINEGLISAIRAWFKRLFSKQYKNFEKTGLVYYKDTPKYNYDWCVKYINNTFDDKNVNFVWNNNDPEQIEQIINFSRPDKSIKRGFWLFDEAINNKGEDSREAYLAINKEPWYIKYFNWVYKDNEIFDVCGLASVSLKYDDYHIENKIARIMDIQTDSKYRGHNLLKKYFADLEEFLRTNHYKCIDLVCYEPSLQKVYEKYGYVVDKDDTSDNIRMFKTLL